MQAHDTLLFLSLLVLALHHSMAGHVPSNKLKEHEEEWDLEKNFGDSKDLDNSLVEYFRDLNPLTNERRGAHLVRRGDADKSGTSNQGCDQTTLSLIGKSILTLTSPGYDGTVKYEKNLDCSYSITAEAGYILQLDFRVMDVENTTNCKFDYIQIFDGQNAQVGNKLCGTLLPNTITVRTNSVLVKFVSDYYFSFTGFVLDVTKVVQSGQPLLDCGVPPAVLFAEVSYPSTAVGSLATYQCHYGYNIQGNAIVLCLADGNWGTLPVCNEIFCNKPVITDQYAIPLYTSTKFGSNMTFSCGDNRMLSNPASHLTCSLDGSWVGIYPVCVNVNCGEPPVVTNAILASRAGIYPGDLANYLCMDGYVNQGGNKLVCSNNGQWQPYNQDVNCQPVSCPVPQSAPINGKVLASNGTVFQSFVTYGCNEGYYLVNVRDTEYTITCLATGRWDKDPPICDMSLCGGLIIKTELSPSGVLTSPNYPAAYSPKRNCTWVIQAPHPGDRITFEVEDMEIEIHEDCQYDRLNLYESNGVTNSKIGTYCGATRPPKIVTLGNFLIVNLYSDEAEVYRGFKASYYFSPTRDRNDITAAALLYYPDLVIVDALDVELDHWVEAIAYINSYTLTVDNMFNHADCLHVLEAFDGLFHLMYHHVLPLLDQYVDDALIRVIYQLNPNDASTLAILSSIMSNRNATTLVEDARFAIDELQIEVIRVLGNVTGTPATAAFPGVSYITENLHAYLMDVVYPQFHHMKPLSIGTNIVDFSSQQMRNLLQIGIWSSPVCPPLPEAVDYLTTVAKTTLDKLLLLLHNAVVKENVLQAFGSQAVFLAESFHKELVEQLHILHSPFEVLAIAWNELKNIQLAALNNTNSIGAPSSGAGLLSEAELLMHSTQPATTGLYEAIQVEHLKWVIEDFLGRDIINSISNMAPDLMAIPMKSISLDHIEGMLKELMDQAMKDLPGHCTDSKLTALVAGIVETSLMDLIRIDLDIANLTASIATIAQSEGIISTSQEPAFSVELAVRYRHKLHSLFSAEVVALEQALEAVTGGPIATETIPMMAIMKAVDTNTITFRELIKDLVHVIEPAIRLNVSCPGVDYHAELKPALERFVEAVQVPYVLDQLVSETIAGYTFTGGAVAYIKEQVRIHYSIILERMTGRINQLTFPNHHTLAKQTVYQFILDQMASQIFQAIALWKPNTPPGVTTSAPPPLPNIVAADMVPLILNQQAAIQIIVNQMMVDMRALIIQLGGGADACLVYPSICSFSINLSVL